MSQHPTPGCRGLCRDLPAQPGGPALLLSGWPGLTCLHSAPTCLSARLIPNCAPLAPFALPQNNPPPSSPHLLQPLHAAVFSCQRKTGVVSENPKWEGSSEGGGRGFLWILHQRGFGVLPLYGCLGAPSLALRSSSVDCRLNPALGAEGGREVEIRMCNSVHGH